MSKFDLFISYSHANKEELVEPLVEALQAAGIRVWFDKLAISIGDSITDKINEGLREARFGLIVISKAYFDSNWARRELNAFFKKQITLKKKFVLPLWYQISMEELFDHFPMLVDYKAIIIDDPSVLSQAVSQINELVQTEKMDHTQNIPVSPESDSSQALLTPQEKQSLESFLEKGQIENAIALLKQSNSLDASKKNTLILLSARYHKMEEAKMQGVSSTDEYLRLQNQLIKALLQLGGK